jgi:hypothetical protein
MTFCPLLHLAFIAPYDMLAQTVRELPFGTVFFPGILADDTGAPD